MLSLIINRTLKRYCYHITKTMTSLLEALPIEIQEIIYEVKHRMEFKDTLCEIENVRAEYYENVIREVSRYFIQSIKNNNPDQRDIDDFYDDVYDYVHYHDLDIDLSDIRSIQLFTPLGRSIHTQCLHGRTYR